MYSGLLIFVSGVLVKTALTIAYGFKKKDWVSIAIAIGVSILGFIIGFSKDLPIQAGIAVFLMTFIGIIAFAFKDRILPRITEGTLLLYGIVSLYLFETHFKSGVQTYPITEWVL